MKATDFPVCPGRPAAPASPMQLTVNPPPAYRADALLSVTVNTGSPFGRNPVFTVETGLT